MSPAPDLKLPPPPVSQDPHRPLPEDLLRDASRRLGIMALIAAVLWVIGTLFGRLAWTALHPSSQIWTQLSGNDVIAATAAGLSLALFFYTRRGNRDPERVLNLGVWWLLITSFDLGLITHWFPPVGEPLEPMISWAGAVVLIYAAIVPTPPRKMLLLGLLVASMQPLGMLVARVRGIWAFDSPFDALLMHHPDYLLVGVSVVIAHVVTRLGQHVSKAREMGSYHLGELLGRGGMGEVYRATHRMLARPAAIKLIRPDSLGGADSEGADMAVKRFRREAEAAASLRSPHTVELYDFGVTEDQTMYFVMELLDGTDLETLVRDHGPVPARRVVHILCQVCDSLEEAHVAGMVHRDIKPANIHVGRLGLQYDFVKVLDFGLVKPVAGKIDEHSLATAAGLTPGTPAYMAPELAMAEAVDGRADIYALGCVAYYLLTGRLVFEGDTSLQVIVKHLQSEPIPPSQRVNAAIPPALDRVVLACLAKKPDGRPATAGDLKRALRAIPIEPWTQEDAKRWWNDKRSSAVRTLVDGTNNTLTKSSLDESAGVRAGL
ncbi:MAG TPA: serine/threonine-protein kinase [Gemmatimonadaceae bacterium]|nr:serine/threonine-protein kinase [Gemmatimonadaceae bacterium]